MADANLTGAYRKAAPSFLAKLLLHEKCQVYTRPDQRLGDTIVQYLGIRFLTLRLLIKHNYYITNKTISNVLFSRTVAFLDCSSSSSSEEALQESNNSSSSDSIISTKKNPKQHNCIHSYSKLACLKKIRKFGKNPQRQSIIKI